MQQPPPDLIDRITRLAETAVSSITVKSALNPALWFCAVVSLPCLALSIIAPSAIQYMLLGIATLPILVVAGGFIYFMCKAPDRLQSESYQLRKQVLTLIEAKGSGIVVSELSVEAITNPELPRLPLNRTGE
jgi:hypothetical protein